MPNPFDILARSTFERVSKTMGYDATWTPSDDENTTHSARVLFKDPSELVNMGTDDASYNFFMFNPLGYLMEYMENDFPGLNEAVRNGKDENVTIEGVEYYIRDTKAVHDGRCYYAKLEKVEGSLEGTDNFAPSSDGDDIVTLDIIP